MKVRNPKATCKTCPYFEKMGVSVKNKDNEVGWCLRYPPTLLPIHKDTNSTGMYTSRSVKYTKSTEKEDNKELEAPDTFYIAMYSNNQCGEHPDFLVDKVEKIEGPVDLS